ncbi:hypothetical protein [uncultured Dokdonia sp.]|uniref:hypothetical protein n=1 Tax=uncultured Dokdonia sp. TaxID=575653 RepID=UPI00260540C8|nr:hypothetical protein [uncultured Dokdonia sp.]
MHKFLDFIWLFLIIIAHLFVFPKLFYLKLDPNEINCGLPMLGVTLSFWIFGMLAAFIAHILWKFICRHTKNRLHKVT